MGCRDQHFKNSLRQKFSRKKVSGRGVGACFQKPLIRFTILNVFVTMNVTDTLKACDYGCMDSFGMLVWCVNVLPSAKVVE